MSIAVIQYNAGNIRSLSFALERAGVDFQITADPEIISKAEKVIFPGVGEASSTIAHLKASGLDRVIRDLKQPTLGICLGMQLLCQYSEEGDTECLGVFPETVKRFPADPGLKVPHMGWNTLQSVRDWISPSLEGQYAYFVHSYYVPVNAFTCTTCHHGIDFSAAMRKDNFYAAQFHPEKSADAGAAILQSFLAL